MYVVIFVCMATIAIRIKVLTNLLIESFILILDRLVAHRGLQTQIDKSTNFVGSNNLVKAVRLREIMWLFIPSRAPHQGDCGKNAKNRLLCDEENSTFFTSIKSRWNCAHAIALLSRFKFANTICHICKYFNLISPPKVPTPNYYGELFLASMVQAPLESTPKCGKAESRSAKYQCWWRHDYKGWFNYS